MMRKTLTILVSFAILFLFTNNVNAQSSKMVEKYIYAIHNNLTIENETIVIDSLTLEKGVDNLADDDSTLFTTGVAGWGQVMAGDDSTWAHFRFTSAGVVTLIDSSASVATTDADGNLVIYDVGSGITIKNRLGSTKKIAYKIEYFTP